MSGLPVELQSSERVVARYRRAPVFFYAKLIGIALAAILPIVALLWVIAATAGLSGTARTIALAVSGVWLLIWLIGAYLVWYRHMHDQWIVTNQRLIDAYKRNWFNQTVASADLVNVQDLSVSKKGLLQSAFNFGDVVCQTAGANSRFVISDVPNPADVMRVIDGTRDAARGAPPEYYRRPPDLGAGEPAGGRPGRATPQFVPRPGSIDGADGPPPAPRG